MTPLEMIAQWRKGCSNTMEFSASGKYLGQCLHPENCPDCTRGLIDAIERVLGIEEARQLSVEDIRLLRRDKRKQKREEVRIDRMLRQQAQGGVQ